MSEITYKWERYWYRRGSTPALNHDGFLPDPATDWGAAINPSLVTFADLSSLPCVVLLGEPGIGKSRVLELEGTAAATRAQENGEIVLSVDLGAIGSDYSLMQEVFDAPEFKKWAEAGGTEPPRLHLYLDALDECLATVSTVAKTLLNKFPRYPTNRLSLRIACRTAAWCGGLGFLEDGLRKIWGGDSVGVYELAPLTRPQVLHAASQSSVVNPEAFVRAVCKVGAQPFAIKPITLNLLLRIHNESGKLPASLADIYWQGCRLLCEETNEGRQSLGRLSVDQRLAVAARIAAVTMFANRYAVFTRPDKGDIPDSDVARAALLGGAEKDGLGTSFPVNEAALTEVLGTGLFTARGLGRLGWAHQTYAEYLAAWYVTDLHTLSEDRLLGLLAHPDDSDRRVAPQLHGVTAWAAPRNPTVICHLIRTDPDVLLACDPTYLDDYIKSQVVDRLVEMVRSKVIFVRDLSGTNVLQRLDFPGLPDQLRQYVRNKGQGVEIRRAAIVIGEACARRELQKEFVDIALDESEPIYLRTHAADVVAQIADADTRRQMLPLAEGRAGEDPDDELKGAGLKAVWPDHITGTQLVALLSPPKNPNWVGKYWRFLSTVDLDRLSDADLTSLLKWVAEQCMPQLAMDHRGHLVQAILSRAWERLDVPNILEAFAGAGIARIKQHETIFVAGTNGRVTLPDMTDDLKRKRFLIALIDRVAEDLAGYIISRLAMQDGLFHEDDLLWLLDCLGTMTPGSSLARAYARLIYCRFPCYRSTSDQFYAIYQARLWSPELAEQYAQCFEPVVCGSDIARMMKDEYDQDKKWLEAQKRPLIDPPTHQRILDCLANFESGQNGAWIELCRTLQLESGYQRYIDDPQPDLTKLPGWKTADETLRTRIMDVAEEYLERQSPSDMEWIGTNRPPELSQAGYQAVFLLHIQRPDALTGLSKSVWQVWAPVVAGYPLESAVDELRPQQNLVALAYKIVPEEVIQTLVRLIDTTSMDGRFLSEMDAFQACVDERLAEVLLAKLHEPMLNAAAIDTILYVLLEYGQHEVPQAALIEAKRLLGALLSAKGSDLTGAADKAHMVARHLVFGASDIGWEVIWPAIQADEAFGREVFESVARQENHCGHQTSSLNEKQIGDLYLWLSGQYLHAEDPESRGCLTDRALVGHWRDDLLHHLVARGTTEACAEMERLIAVLPHLTWLPRLLRQAQDATRRNTWVPLTPEQVIRLASDSDFRLIRTEAELLAVVVESLGRLQKALQGETPAAIDVWNEIPAAQDDLETNPVAGPDGTDRSTKRGRRRATSKTYRPKSENALSDYVKRHLERDLKGRGIISGREVEIRSGTDGGAQGEITDIYVSAIASRVDGREDAHHDVVRVICETKCGWNEGLDTAMEQQLVNRYLRANSCRHGIYLVGWYQCKQWDSRDTRKRKHCTGSIEDLRARLDLQASNLSQRSGVTVTAVVLDASLR